MANEWWEKFSNLSDDKLAKAKNIIALNRFRDGECECDDAKIEDVLCYYKTTSNDAEI